MLGKSSKLVLINIKSSYKESRPNNYSYYDDIDSAMNDINNKNTCTLEVLSQLSRKIYLDIENIPKDNVNLINKLIESFTKFMNINLSSYCLTFNKKSSQHEGLSYHLILPYVMYLNELKQCVLMFKTQHPEYENYIDDGVYSMLRLFRLPNNGKPTGNGIDNDDAHEILKGTINDAFIQVIDGFPLITGEQLPKNFNTFDVKSAERNSNKQKCKHSGGLKIEQFADNLLIEFNKLKESMDMINDQQSKILKMNDILFNKIIELEKTKI